MNVLTISSFCPEDPTHCTKDKRQKYWKEDVKLSIYSDNIIIYILRNLKTSIIHIYKSELKKVTRHNITFENQLYAFFTNSKC